MITNSDLFFEINGTKKKKSSYKKYSRKNGKKLIEEKKKLFNKFLKIVSQTLNHKIDQKTFSAVAGSYTNYFIEFFVYYYFFSLKTNVKNKKLKINFNLKHNFEYFYNITQEKEFILHILYCIKYKKEKDFKSSQDINFTDLNLIHQKFSIKNANLYKKKIVEILFHQTRQVDILKQLKNKKLKILDKKNFEHLKLKTLSRNKDLRYNFIKNFNAKTTIEKQFLDFFYNFYSTLYLESILMNLSLISNDIKYFPKVIMSDAHGWFMNDNFRHYLGIQSFRGTKILDFQINGATNLTYHNPHVEVASKFCDEIVLWIHNDLNINRKFLCLPSLYFSRVQNSKLTKKNNNFEILYFGCGISKYFKGFWSSYISGGYLKEYLESSFTFLSNIKKRNLKNLKFRLRIENFFMTKNSKKHKIKFIFNHLKLHGFKYTLKRIINELINKYLTFKIDSQGNQNLIDNKKKKFFKSINYDPILPNEVGIERMKKANILIVDHPSTPVFEALSLNKPTIIFWDQNINIVNPNFKNILIELTKYKILFFSPKAAAFQLNKYLENKNSIEKLWYQNKRIQLLIKKIRAMLLNNGVGKKNITVINQWDQFIKLEINS